MSTENRKIEILLATYNGERYLPELLASIEKQSHSNWFLRISDDHSTDGTLNVLSQFKKKYPRRVEIGINNTQLGAAANFMSLMAAAESEVIAFCDQDDVWYRNKLEKLLLEYEKLKRISGSSCRPVLVYSDAVITDENLNTIHESLFQFHSNSDPDSHTLERLIYKNCITGCTVITNQTAINLSLRCAKRMNSETSAKIIMHDYWLGLIVAQYNGLFSKIYEPLLMYRQHSNNAIGAQKEPKDLKYLIQKYKNVRSKYDMINYLFFNKSFFQYCFMHFIKKCTGKI